MADMSYDQNVTLVDTGAMRETATLIRDKIKVVNATTSELVACLEKMQSIWDSAAAKEYIEAYKKSLAGVIAHSMVYDALSSELNQCAEEYERAHGLAVSIAESIEMPSWTEPEG